MFVATVVSFSDFKGPVSVSTNLELKDLNIENVKYRRYQKLESKDLRLYMQNRNHCSASLVNHDSSGIIRLSKRINKNHNCFILTE